MAVAFSEQVAVVTGGGQGLGEGIATMLDENGAGKVVIFDVDETKGQAVANSLKNGVFFKVDVSSEESVKDAFQKVQEMCGRVDVMVNAAGIVGPNGVKLDQVETSAFDKVYEINVRGSFLMTKYSLLEMKKRDYGRILLIASIAGKEGNAGMSAYSTSKAAVIGLTKAVGKEYAETGITVNALAPAVVRTAMVEAMDPAQVKYMTDKIPMKRCCTIEEVASMCKFILSKESSFTTAFTFDLTGGRATY